MPANELPDELQTALKYLLGMEWPEGDVDGLNRISSAWSELSGAMETMAAALQRSSSGVQDNMGGEFAQAYRDFSVAMRQTMGEIRTNADGLADVSKSTAADITYAKVMIIGQLVIMLAMMALEWIPFIGPALAAAAQVIARVVISQILAKVIANILLGAAMGLVLELGLDVAIQGVQMLTGQRTDWNEDFTTGAAISGVVSGAVGGAAGSLLHMGIGALGRGVGKDAGKALDEIAPPPPKTETGGPGLSEKGGAFGKPDGPLDDVAPPVKEGTGKQHGPVDDVAPPIKEDGPGTVKEDGPGSSKTDETGPNTRDEDWQAKSWSDRNAKQKWLSAGNFIAQGPIEGAAEVTGEAVATAASGQRVQEGGLPAFTSGTAQSYLENGLGKGGRSLTSRYGSGNYANLTTINLDSMGEFQEFGATNDGPSSGPGRARTESNNGDQGDPTIGSGTSTAPTTEESAAPDQQNSGPPSYEEATGGDRDTSGGGRFSNGEWSGEHAESIGGFQDAARPPSYEQATGGDQPSGADQHDRSDSSRGPATTLSTGQPGSAPTGTNHDASRTHVEAVREQDGASDSEHTVTRNPASELRADGSTSHHRHEHSDSRAADPAPVSAGDAVPSGTYSTVDDSVPQQESARQQVGALLGTAGSAGGQPSTGQPDSTGQPTAKQRPVFSGSPNTPATPVTTSGETKTTPTRTIPEQDPAAGAVSDFSRVAQGDDTPVTESDLAPARVADKSAESGSVRVDHQHRQPDQDVVDQDAPPVLRTTDIAESAAATAHVVDRGTANPDLADADPRGEAGQNRSAATPHERSDREHERQDNSGTGLVDTRNSSTTAPTTPASRPGTIAGRPGDPTAPSLTEVRERARVEANAAERALGKLAEGRVHELRLHARRIVGIEHQLPDLDTDRSLFLDVEWMVTQQLHEHGWTPHTSDEKRTHAETRAREFAIGKAHELGTRRTHLPPHGFGGAPGNTPPTTSHTNPEAGPSNSTQDQYQWPEIPWEFAMPTDLESWDFGDLDITDFDTVDDLNMDDLLDPDGNFFEGAPWAAEIQLSDVDWSAFHGGDFTPSTFPYLPPAPANPTEPSTQTTHPTPNEKNNPDQHRIKTGNPAGGLFTAAIIFAKNNPKSRTNKFVEHLKQNNSDFNLSQKSTLANLLHRAKVEIKWESDNQEHAGTGTPIGNLPGHARRFVAEKPESGYKEFIKHLREGHFDLSGVSLGSVRSAFMSVKMTTRLESEIKSRHTDTARPIGNLAEHAREFAAKNPKASTSEFIEHLQKNQYDLRESNAKTIISALHDAKIKNQWSHRSNPSSAAPSRPIGKLAEHAREFAQEKPGAGPKEFTEHLQENGYDLSDVKPKSLRNAWNIAQKEARFKSAIQPDSTAMKPPVQNIFKEAQNLIQGNPEATEKEFAEAVGEIQYAQLKPSSVRAALNRAKRENRQGSNLDDPAAGLKTNSDTTTPKFFTGSLAERARKLVEENPKATEKEFIAALGGTVQLKSGSARSALSRAKRKRTQELNSSDAAGTVKKAHRTDSDDVPAPPPMRPDDEEAVDPSDENPLLPDLDGILDAMQLDATADASWNFDFLEPADGHLLDAEPLPSPELAPDPRDGAAITEAGEPGETRSRSRDGLSDDEIAVLARTENTARTWRPFFDTTYSPDDTFKLHLESMDLPSHFLVKRGGTYPRATRLLVGMWANDMLNHTDTPLGRIIKTASMGGKKKIEEYIEEAKEWQSENS